MKIKQSNILSSLPKYAFASVDEQVQTLKSAGVKVIDFGVGDHTLPTPKVAKERLKTAVDEFDRAGYPAYQGAEFFRVEAANWIKKRFGVELDHNKNIASTIGSKEAVFNAPLAFANPSDYVIVPNPGYPPYHLGAKFAGANVHFVSLSEDNRFLVDFDEIPKNVAEKAKILWLCYPNSPTGVIADAEFYKRALDFCDKHEILLCSDEAYSEIYFDFDNPPISALNVSTENVLSFFSMSKRSMMTGWRIGWVAGDAEAVSTFKTLKTNIDSGTPNFVQAGAVEALKDEEHVREMREITLKKREILCDAFAQLGLEDCRPQASLYVWQKAPEGLTGKEFTEILLKPEIGIVCTPGAALSQNCDSGSNPGENYVRFALVPTIEEIEEACYRLQNLAKFL
ncbi:MAG: aminotransferase class I/II-fold pyridoxal phosphate-dependent enzyme [Planctomycetes bacterium]|nr:aminotransferase class I/II-fold pyridoxal phosphate-dependent enzyme [Planctomycetota bacterium]